jgi:hypothetical protein
LPSDINSFSFNKFIQIYIKVSFCVFFFNIELTNLLKTKGNVEAHSNTDWEAISCQEQHVGRARVVEHVQNGICFLFNTLEEFIYVYFKKLI